MSWYDLSNTVRCEIGGTQGPLGYVSVLGATHLVNCLHDQSSWSRRASDLTMHDTSCLNPQASDNSDGLRGESAAIQDPGLLSKIHVKPHVS